MPVYEIREKDGVKTWYPEIAEGIFSETGTTTDPGGTAVYRASRVGRLYTPEAQKRTIDTSLLPDDGNDSLYFTSHDGRPDEIKHPAWQAAGANRLSDYTSNDSPGSKWSEVPNSKRFVYITQSAIPGEGFWWWAWDFREFVTRCLQTIPRFGPGVIVFFNIETNNFWQRFYHGDANGQGSINHYPPWPEIKNIRINLESRPGSMTVEELFNSGFFSQEINVRRANRFHAQMDIAASAGADVGHGSSPYQGDAREDALTGSGRFLDEGGGNVDHVGGSNGSITIDGFTFNRMNESFWVKEKVSLDYYYLFTMFYKGVDVQTLYESSSPLAQEYHAHTSYPELWQHITMPNPAAREIAHILGNEKRLEDVHGPGGIPMVFQFELFGEGNLCRVPNGFGLQFTYFDGNSPKTWFPPTSIRTRLIIHQLMAGERAKAGRHLFYSAGADGSNKQGIIFNKDAIANLNHHWHTSSAIFAVVKDMNLILDKVANTVRTTTLDIKVGGTGEFQRYNGVDAWLQNKPGAFTRHKTTSHGLSVILVIGYGQPKDTIRTDIVSIPGVGNGNTIKCTYQGEDLQVFEVLFPNGVTNTEFLAKSIVPAQTKPGYGFRVNQ